MDVIEKLFYGELHPFERVGESEEALAKLIEAETKLIESFSKEQAETFRLYSECRTKLQCDGELAAFREGLKLGIQLMPAVRE